MNSTKENIMNYTRLRNYQVRKQALRSLALLCSGLFMFTALWAQDATSSYTIEGIVLDMRTKEAIPAAQITALNNQKSAISGEDGKFTLSLAYENDILRINAYDYNPVEISIAGRTSVEILLYPDVFVSKYEPKDLPMGSSYSSQYPGSGAKFESMDLPYRVSIDEGLQSPELIGLRSISRSGTAGMGAALFIRGFNSIHRNSQPLIIVDGVIWEQSHEFRSTHKGFYVNPLADINVNDIESVSILKEGTSIYGSKGANGVIYIQTRRARDLATRITVNAHAGIQDMPSSLPMMNVDQNRIYISELVQSTNMTGNEIAALPFLNDDPAEITYNEYHNNTDWDQEVYQPGISQSYNIGVTGGDDKALYAFSLGYTGSKGVVQTTDMQRLNMRFNGDINMNDFMDLDVNVGFTNNERVLVDDGVNYYTSPSYLAMIKSPFLSPYAYTITGSLTTIYEDSDMFGIGNPSAILANSSNTNKHYRLNLGAKPSIQIAPNLELSSQFDYSLDKTKEFHFIPSIGSAVRIIPGFGYSDNTFSSQTLRRISLYNDTRLSYATDINVDHQLNLILGWRILSSKLEGDFGEGHNTGTDETQRLLPGLDFKRTEGVLDFTRYISNYATLDYSFRNKYFMNAALAIDGSSVFGDDIQGALKLFNSSWGVFPSINVAWLATGEEFLNDLTFIDLLKIRASYGISGNDDIYPYAALSYFSPYRYIAKASAIVLSSFQNSNIQWENTARTNLGIDASFLNNRISLGADVYTSRTTNLLYLETLPYFVGEGVYWNNGGEISNVGFDLNSSLIIVNSENLMWEAGISIGKYKNTVITAPTDDNVLEIYDAEIRIVEERPVGAFYGYKALGVISTETEAETLNLKMINDDGEEVYFGPGDMIFEDFVEDGIIDEQDKQYLGDPNPDFYGAFNTRLVYKAFKLEALFTYSYGNEVYNYLRKTLESGSDYTNQTLAVLSRWQTGGQETMQPRIAYGDPMGNARFSDRWIEDGSYLKLKSLSLSYEVPLKSTSIDGLEIWIAGTNLWTLTNYLGRDPEVTAGNSVLYQGIDIGLLPQTRNIILGVRANL